MVSTEAPTPSKRSELAVRLLPAMDLLAGFVFRDGASGSSWQHRYLALVPGGRQRFDDARLSSLSFDPIGLLLRFRRSAGRGGLCDLRETSALR